MAYLKIRALKSSIILAGLVSLFIYFIKLGVPTFGAHVFTIAQSF